MFSMVFKIEQKSSLPFLDQNAIAVVSTWSTSTTYNMKYLYYLFFD